MTEDAEITAAVEVVEDLLDLVSPDKRLAVLAAAVAREKAARKKRKAGPLVLTLTEFMGGWEQSPRCRYWHDIMRLKSLVIQVFTRSITNNHSKEDAARILFTDHRNKGTGSGWLPDYLDGLPAIEVDIKRAAAIADARPGA